MPVLKGDSIGGGGYRVKGKGLKVKGLRLKVKGGIRTCLIIVLVWDSRAFDHSTLECGSQSKPAYKNRKFFNGSIC